MWVVSAAVLLSAAAWWGRGWGAELCEARAVVAFHTMAWPRAKVWLDRDVNIHPCRGRTALLQARLARRRGRLLEFSEWIDRARSRAVAARDIEVELLLAAAQTGDLAPLEPRLGLLLAEAGDLQPEICEAFVNGCVLNY